MIDSIKITSLTNIGANLSYTSIVPVVDVTANVTYKANLQIIGNLILSGAGGSNFVQAAQANLAQAVVNSAQPNITSVGTLISLAVTGNANVSGLTSLTTLNVATAANLGAVGNIVITGGTVGQKLTTNGNGGLSWTNDADSSYSNSNVAAYLPTYTGNIGAGNINVTGLTSLAVLTVSTTANLGAANNITITGGSNGQVLTTNGNGVLSWTTVSGNINTWSFGNTGAVQSPIVTFSALPAATTPGLRAFISDANLVPAGNFGVEVSGGGGNYVPVFSDGANWCIG